MFSAENYAEILKKLEDAAEPAYRDFHARLLPGANVAYGVRVPLLRKMAREILKEDWRGFLQVARQDSYEERMLQGFVLALCREEFSPKFAAFCRFAPHMGDWCVCDCACAAFKEIKAHREETFPILQEMAQAPQEFTVRAALVVFLDYFADSVYIDRVLAAISACRHPGYYAKMAAAWALSVLFLTDSKKTADVILRMDAFVQKQAVKKIKESYRASKEEIRILQERLAGGQAKAPAHML